ncbi:alpha/beta fold hydrolase [Leifsonia naganoensis]|uniref:Pimeloyl-ACP methyl ester carboxylesterase n=1 Tax=Leifsonia naganoensis TaxID=150025 RepID=A0A853DNW3_9MICO|nr:alpha/beta hydrolase [Leifsonia naganoensis]NYK10158.1 pimeloyl-ACP methyl ester carboxylesterase [Leifsonia naganoensis]
MTDQKPAAVLVHGAFAESASWNGVIERLQQDGLECIAVANPLRSLAGDAAYVRDVIAAVGRPVVLVGHSYGGLVISEASSGNDAVSALVYVNAFVPEHGQTAFDLSTEFPGSTLGDALAPRQLADGSVELVIQPALFHRQFCADVPDGTAALMAATQRPVTQAALTEPLPTAEPGWKTIPTWCVFSDRDLNIPVAEHRAGAARAKARLSREVPGGSHALSVSQPAAVAETILAAVAAVGSVSVSA